MRRAIINLVALKVEKEKKIDNIALLRPIPPKLCVVDIRPLVTLLRLSRTKLTVPARIFDYTGELISGVERISRARR